MPTPDDGARLGEQRHNDDSRHGYTATEPPSDNLGSAANAELPSGIETSRIEGITRLEEAT